MGWRHLEKLLGVPGGPPSMVPAPIWGPVHSELDNGEVQEGKRM